MLLAELIAEDKKAGRTGMDSKLYRYQEAKKAYLANVNHFGKNSEGAKAAAKVFKAKLTKDRMMKKDKDGKETNINEAVGLDPKLATQFISVLENKGTLPKKKAKEVPTNQGSSNVIEYKNARQGNDGL